MDAHNEARIGLDIYHAAVLLTSYRVHVFKSLASLNENEDLNPKRDAVFLT